MADAAATRTWKPPAPEPVRKRPVRSIAAVVLLVIGALLLPPGVVGFWGQNTIRNTDKYLATVGPLINYPEVQAVVTGQITQAIHSSWDIKPLLEERLPANLKPLAGPLSSAINAGIDREVARIVASPAFASTWIAINRVAQQALVAALSHPSSGAVTVQNDQVVLDTHELMVQVQQRLVEQGYTVLGNVPLPEGQQIVLFNAAALDEARTIYSLTSPIAFWLIWVVLALLVAAVALARDHLRMLVIAGLTTIAMMGLLRWGIAYGESHFNSALSSSVLGPASDVFYRQLTNTLIGGTLYVGLAGLVAVVVGVGLRLYERRQVAR